MDQETVREQINEWYLLHSKDIYQYIFFLIGDREQARDLMQDTFLKAYSKYSHFNGENVKGWLFRIARNTTIDFLRRKKPLSFFTDTLPLLKSNAASPEEVLFFNETERELYQVLNKLKRPYRDVIILRKIEEFTIQETCQILGWSESKVKSNLARGLKVLKVQMEKEVGRGEAI